MMNEHPYSYKKHLKQALQVLKLETLCADFTLSYSSIQKDER